MLSGLGVSVDIAGNAEVVTFDYEDMSNRLMNDNKLMRSISEMFYQDMVKQITELKISIKENDIDQVTAILHQIKGSSANVGGKALSALAHEMELAVKARGIKVIQGNIEQLEDNFNTLKASMEQAL